MSLIHRKSLRDTGNEQDSGVGTSWASDSTRSANLTPAPKRLIQSCATTVNKNDATILRRNHMKSSWATATYEYYQYWYPTSSRDLEVSTEHKQPMPSWPKFRSSPCKSCVASLGSPKNLTRSTGMMIHGVTTVVLNMKLKVSIDIKQS